MGCDIHLFVEAKNKDDKWVMVDNPTVNRNYDLFEKMAGVRGESYNALVQPRGLPDNVSEGTRLHRDYWGEDGHTESYLKQSEIEQLEKWIDKQEGFGFCSLGYMFGNGFSLSHDDFRDTGVKDVRLVFWFDN
jgi:hypothetical protein